MKKLIALAALAIIPMGFANSCGSETKSAEALEQSTTYRETEVFWSIWNQETLQDQREACVGQIQYYGTFENMVTSYRAEGQAIAYPSLTDAELVGVYEQACANFI